MKNDMMWKAFLLICVISICLPLAVPVIYRIYANYTDSQRFAQEMEASMEKMRQAALKKYMRKLDKLH